jgi:hypothetical protein
MIFVEVDGTPPPPPGPPPNILKPPGVTVKILRPNPELKLLDNDV